MRIKSRKKLNILVLFIYTLIIIFIYNLFYKETLNITVGEVASENIVSKETFENKEATKLQKAQARNSVANVYKVVPNVSIETKNNILELGSSILELKYTGEMTTTEKLKYLKSNSPYILREESFRYLLNSSSETINKISSISLDLLAGTYNRGVKESDLATELDLLKESVKGLEDNPRSADVIKEILSSALVANEVLDEEKTNELKSLAEEKVEPVIIEKGDIVILKGETITEEKLELLALSGNQLTDGSNLGFLRQFTPHIFIIVSIVVYTIYIYNLEPLIYLSSKLYIILISNLTAIIMTYFLSQINALLIPVLMVALIISFYVEKRIILVNGLYISVLISYFETISIAAFAYLNLIGVLVMIFVKNDNSRNSNFVMSVISAVIAAFIYNIYQLTSLDLLDFWLNILIALGSGIVYMILAIGLSFFWENVFNLLTPNRLQELSDTNQPLLKLLAEKAPGTYQHSLMVANLAESAAMAIGADYQLVKVGAMYHDVGKINNPDFFKENQFGIENPHNELAPQESARIILSHMDDGRALAKKYNLPKEIIKFIEEHHGDTLVGYFYFEAKLEDENIDENLFKYRGRKPQSAETAIVMLADSCEAAVRSIKNKTEENIFEMINNIVDGKIKDKQFIECDLSFYDVERIKVDMFTNLKSIFHERIEYPSKEPDPV